MKFIKHNVDIIICLIAIKTITATKNIKYKLWLQRLDIQTNNISISISLGFKKFSEMKSNLNVIRKKPWLQGQNECNRLYYDYM
jgi:hypothetical protein